MIESCPKCGLDTGFCIYIVQTIELHYDFTGNIVDSTVGMTRSGLTAGRGGNIAYCSECGYKLGNVHDILHSNLREEYG